MVTAGDLTKEFAKARDASGAYKDLPAKAKPTFHELRAYGSWLYEQQGFEKAYVQALMGHANEKSPSIIKLSMSRNVSNSSG